MDPNTHTHIYIYIEREREREREIRIQGAERVDKVGVVRADKCESRSGHVK